MTEPTTTPPPAPKKSSGCLKIFLWTAGTLLFLFIVCVIVVVQAVNWVKNAPEPTVATYAPLTLSPGEAILWSSF